MQRPGPPGKAALSFGRSSLGPEATGSKSSPSCKAERLDRASGSCRLRQAAGLLRCRSSGRGGGCAAPAPAVCYFPLRSQCAGLRSRSGARLHRMVLTASPVWQSATTTSGAKWLGVWFFFFLVFLNSLFKAITKLLWLSRQSSANCERSQGQRNAMALRAPCTQPCAGCRCRGPSDRLGAGAGRGGERRPRTPQSGTEVSAGSRGSRKAPTRLRPRVGRVPTRSFSASSESRPAQRCRPGEPSPGSPARCPAERRARLARTSRTPRSAAAPSAARGAPAARPHLTRREGGVRRPGLPRAGVSARLPRHIGGADPARAVPAAAPRCPAAVPE